MKACPACGRMYPEDAGFCPVDGQPLTSATQVPVASDEHDPRVGQLVAGRYQIRRVVADGGMGRVYEGLDTHERRNVALKILHPEVVSDAIAVERFKREFEVSKQLPHEHIVDVLDFVPSGDGSYALVMEFLYGEELRNTLKREHVISPGRLVRMLSQAALALDVAHERKLVHRDLKPDNIFLCQTHEGDIVKLLDFGSVKDKADNAKKLTVMGTTLGSPYYMAPEQAQALDTLDQRADVWAMGAITYECVTGQVPFQGVNGPSILLQILTKEPSPPSVAAMGQTFPVPPTLDRVMLYALKKQAALRIASMGALADAVGGAYGLGGNHLDWARADERALTAQIEAQLPALMVAPPPAAAVTDGAADSFFGEASSLEAMNDPFAPPAPPMPVGGPPPGASFQQAEDELAAIPKSGSALWIIAAVGGAALILGVVIVVLVMR